MATIYPQFAQPLGIDVDARFYSVDVNEWLKGRAMVSYSVTSENDDMLKVDLISDTDGVISFRAKDAKKGIQIVKIVLAVVGATITRRYGIKVKSL